jgi:CIC family chloride channel protein
MFALCAFKVVATVFSYSSGGAGGIFAPSLFIGGTLGGALGFLDAALLGHNDQPSGAFALVGMGAVFAGVIRAPITSVLIIVEMTHAYSLILPLMIANMSAYVIARRFRPVPIYEALLAQDGIFLPRNAENEALEHVSIGALVNYAAKIQSFQPAASAEEVARVTREVTTQHVYPVLDESKHLLGLITPDELTILRTEPELLRVANASDLMRPPISIQVEQDLPTVLETMLRGGIREIPVTDANGGFIGWIDEETIAKAYASDRERRSAIGRSNPAAPNP